MHSHHHDNHSHAEVTPDSSAAFVIGIILNVGFVAIELFYGWLSHSLSLVADAWHNLGDVAGLAISLLALQMAKIKPNKTYTYGLSKGTILASLANAVLLLLAVGSIGYEAIQRFLSPEVPAWNTMWLVALIGVGINTATALLFMRRNEMNSRAAFLHMAADAGVSLAVVLGAFAIHFTGFIWLDPLLSIVICLVILLGTWNLLKNSLRLSLDGIPENVNLESIKQAATEIPGVTDIHHLHVWAISTTKNALTAHLLIQPTLSKEDEMRIRNEFRHRLLHLNVHHATVELEFAASKDCNEC